MNKEKLKRRKTMKYKLDKEILKEIRESDREEIELEITDDKIELVKNNNEWDIGDKYYFVDYNIEGEKYVILNQIIANIDVIKAIKKDKSAKYFHTKEGIEEYIDWLNIRTVVEDTLDELGRPTREEVENRSIKLYYCYDDFSDTQAYSFIGYEQPFLCKKPFIDRLIGKIGEEKVSFFYKNLWRFL